MSDSTSAWLRWMALASALCAILVLPVAWDASQSWIFPDSTSYLDMAANAVRDSPAVLLKNAYWSPAYPAVFALTMAVARPSLAAEVPGMYIVHWLIFVFATACFSLLLGTFLQWLRRNSWPELASDRALFKALVCFAYAFFLLANMNQTLWYLTPDMLLQGLVYLSAAYALRLFLPESSWKHSAALGLALGFGYLTKAAMFPATLPLLALLFLKPPEDHWRRRHAAIALVCFCLVAAPLVLSLSHEKHRFTIGDSGKLNYAWFVAGIPVFSGWNGQPAENGIPAHAPRRVSEAPLILEFRAPVSGTQPLWYDPSYWWEGLRVPFSVQNQLYGLFRPFTQAHSMQTVFLALAAALAPLCLFSSRVRKVIRGGGIQTWILIVWPAATCLMYSLVLFNFRYVAPYLVLICLGAAALLLQPFRSATRSRALLAAALVLALVAVVRLRPAVQAAFRPDDGGPLTREEGRDNRTSSAAVAQELARLGIRPGDEISVLGHSLDCYYARLAGVRIVAQIWEDPEQVSGLSVPQVRQVLSQLKQIGVKALVSRSKPGFVNDEGWTAIPRTDVFVRIL
jgi:4-amino-4-deoxy-L-arabinose transferase-like glycosyltransferase